MTVTVGRERRAGVVVGVLGVAVLSPDSLLLRFAECGDFAASAARAFFIAIVAGTIALVFPSQRRGLRLRPFLLYAAVFGFGTVSFALSVKNTHIANTLVILTTAPLMAAAGARIFIGERIAPQTWAAALAVALGVLAIFVLRSDSAPATAGVGDLFALGAAAGLAANNIILRRNREMSAPPGLALGGLLALAASAPFADFGGVSAADAGWLALNGAVVVPGAFLLTAYAARRLPPPEITLLFLLETVFGSSLAWFFLGEAPPRITVAAAVVIVGAVGLHSYWSLRRR